MTSKRSKPSPHMTKPNVFARHCWCLVLYFTLLACFQPAFADDIPEVPTNGAEAWLVTFGPGEIYWERFGHNAIWLREPAADINHTFNFGFFDFDQKNFFLRFIRGRMLYFSGAQPAVREFEFYRQENRSIQVQKLNLSPPQYRRLRDYLLNEIKPGNRDYRYDYYLSNCSTRVRDTLDLALDGALRKRTDRVPARLNFRDQTRRLTQMQYWYYLGLELALGFPVDRHISRWDEMFIPMVIAEEIADMSLGEGESREPLVLLDTMLFTATRPATTTAPATIWHRYLVFGLLLAGLAWLSGKFMPPVWLAGLGHAWLLISASLGLILAALWLFTDHQVASVNVNLLLLNPLLLVALAPALRRFGTLLLAGGVAVCLLLLALPQHQYNLDVLAMLAPVNLAVAVYLFDRNRIRRT